MSKNSFMLYCDQKNMISKISNDQAGILLKKLYEYVCNPDKIPVFDDPITDMVFTSMKSSIDRDKIKYERVCQRNKLNGVKGGRPKIEKDYDNQ